MSTYAVSMSCPHATMPNVKWQVVVVDEVNGGLIDEEQHSLFVPHLSTWTIDSLRMILYELAAYLPAHDDAQVTITAKSRRSGGRPRKDGRTRQPDFDDRSVELRVSARGWGAIVSTWRNCLPPQREGESAPHPGWFSEPMQAVLLDLVAKSPFPLSVVTPVDCGDPRELRIIPSRRDVLQGLEPPDDEPDAQAEARAKRLKQMRRMIDDLLGGK